MSSEEHRRPTPDLVLLFEHPDPFPGVAQLDSLDGDDTMTDTVLDFGHLQPPMQTR